MMNNRETCQSRCTRSSLAAAVRGEGPGGLVVHCVLLGFRVGDGNIAGFEPPVWTQQTEESER